MSRRANAVQTRQHNHRFNIYYLLIRHLSPVIYHISMVDLSALQTIADEAGLNILLLLLLLLCRL